MTNNKIKTKFYPGSNCRHINIKELFNLTVRQLTKKGIVICYQDRTEYKFPVSELEEYPD